MAKFDTWELTPQQHELMEAIEQFAESHKMNRTRFYNLTTAEFWDKLEELIQKF